MNYNIQLYPLFIKELKRLAKRYKSIKEDLETLRKELLENPKKGVNIGRGVYKVRMSISAKGKGKSGGARVITVLLDISEDEKEIGLHYIYDKSEKESLTDKQINEILKANGII